MDRQALRALILEILQEQQGTGGIRKALPDQVVITEADRLHTGRTGDQVFTHDLFTLEESPRLGAGVMEMRETTFPWTLQYDEIDYVLEGTLSIRSNGSTVTAGPGQLILIPKGSAIEFSAPDYARFLYITYPADWQGQG
jgi:ethanolamine utilization protein EutQ